MRTAVNRRSFLKATTGVPLGILYTAQWKTTSGAPITFDTDFGTLTEAARAIRGGVISSLELTQHTLARIEQYNPTLNAIVTLLEDTALAQARAADEALAKGQWWGPLHGVPITIKNALAIAGVRTTAGVPALSDNIPNQDATVVTRLRSAGAVILGNTNVSFMLRDWQSYNTIHGTTNNPWDLERTPGGSTGGGAAALAAGLSYLSVGSDIGGSIRIPAHFSGVYGHKPTLGIVPPQGHIPPLPGDPPKPLGRLNLNVVGPLARSATDLKIALSILGGPDNEKAIAYRWVLPPARRTRITDCRIGFVMDSSSCPVSSDVKEILVAAIETLRRAGVSLEEGWPPDVDPVKQYDTYRYLLFATGASSINDDQVEELRKRAMRQDGSREAIEALARTARHKYFQAADNERIAARAAWQKYFRTHDAFLMPTAFAPAFRHDHRERSERTIATPEGLRPYDDMLFWIAFASLTGLPATTAPVGQTKEGLPVGMQIMGPYFEDATPIDIAGQMADFVGGFQAPPGFSQ
ncbi:MAG: amidase [Acidobacteriota bacterium]|nr:amidase [Acidobacteriota bacterium]